LLQRVIVAIDPPTTAHKKSDACGIIVAGIDDAGIGFVLEDGTVREATPNEWSTKAVALYHRFDADLLVAEVNQGGDMVATIINQLDASVPVKAVRAARGKYVRAEPVAALYEQARVRHVGGLSKLEDEMCDFGLDGLSSRGNPYWRDEKFANGAVGLFAITRATCVDQSELHSSC